VPRLFPLAHYANGLVDWTKSTTTHNDFAFPKAQISKVIMWQWSMKPY